MLTRQRAQVCRHPHLPVPIAKMSEDEKPKSPAEVLKAAMAAKKAGGQGGGPKPRAHFGQAKAIPDAERRGGKSRKVH